MKLTTTVFLLLLSSFSFAQLSVKSRGRVFDANGEQLRVARVREILSTKPNYLDLYDEGRTKKTAGNVLLIGGATLILADLAVGFTQDKQYPTALTAVGALALIIAIPVKVGYSKKIRKSIDGYNGKVADNSTISLENLSICSNRNGIGLRFNF